MPKLDLGGSSRPNPQIKLGHALTPKALLGGSRSEVHGGSSVASRLRNLFSRARADDPPRMRSQGRHKGDEVLLRTGGRGALVLGRMARAMGGEPLARAPQGGVAPGNGVQGTPQSGSGNAPIVVPPAPDKLAELGAKRDTLQLKLAGLGGGGQPRDASTKARIEAQASRVGLQTKLKAGADAALAELGGVLKAKLAALEAAEADPAAGAQAAALKSEVARLKAIRKDLVGVAIAAELGGLGKLAAGPTLKAAVMTAMWTLHGPGRDTREPLIGQSTILNIGRMVDEFNAGGTAAYHDGRPATFAAFARTLDSYARTLEGSADRKLGQAAAGELRQLAQAFRVRAVHQEAAETFGRLLDRSPDMPVGGALRAIAGVLPGLRALGGEASGIGDLGKAAEGLRDIAAAIESGHPLDNMQGHDAGFDKAWLAIKRDKGAERAVEHLRDERARLGKPLPAAGELAELTALAAKPEGELTVAERVRLLDLVGRDKLSTLAEARGIVERMNGDLGAAAEAGRRAAGLHHESVALNRTFAQNLTVDRRVWYKPSTWGDKAVRVFSESSSVLKGPALLKALQSYAGKDAGREVALLTAHLAQAEFETVKAEKLAYGLHPHLAVTSLMPDAANPLAHVGISNAELEGIGLTEADMGDVRAVVQNFHRQGVGGIDAVRGYNEDIRSVGEIVLRSTSAQNLVTSFQGESARAMGQHLLDTFMLNAETSYLARFPGPDRSGPPSLDTHAIQGHFTEEAGALKGRFDQADPQAWDALKAGAAAYRDAELGVALGYGDHGRVEAEMGRARALLRDKGKALGLDLDPHSPRGLRSAKAILTALRSDEEAMTASTPARREAALERLEGALDRLRGFDTESMRRPWHAKLGAMLGRGEAPPKETLESLREVAEAIVFVREDGPELLRQTAGMVSDQGATLDAILAERRAEFPSETGAVNDMVRAAVLSEWRNAKTDVTVKDGAASESFNPAVPPARALIEKRLKDWGLDLERFAPELDSVLFAPLSPEELGRWAQEARISDATRAKLTEAEPRFFSQGGVAGRMKAVGQAAVDMALNRSAMDAETRGRLVALLGSFQEGDKLDLKAGQRVTLDSNKIPMDPGGIIGIKARIAAAHLGQFEIERGSDGYKLHLRTGVEGKGNLDFVAGDKFDMGGGAELSAEGSVGLEGSASRLTGVTLSFRNDAAGLDALLDLVGKMVDGKPITYRDWKDASDVGSTGETRGKVGLGVGVTGRALFGGKGPKLNGVGDMLGAGLVGGSSASLSVGTKRVGTESLNETTTKSEVEYSFTAGASLGLYARLYNPLNIGTGFAATGSGGQSGADGHFGMKAGKDGISGTADDKPLYNMNDNVANQDLVNAGISVTLSYTDKSKVVRDADGLYKKCESVRQSNLAKSAIQKFSAVDTPAMRAVLEHPGNAALRADLKTFMDLMGGDDSIAVTYVIREDRLAEANELVRRAQAALRQGDGAQAAIFEDLAGRIVNDSASYRPAKVGLLTVGVKKDEVTNINARYIRWDSFSDGKSEHQGATLTIPELLVAA